MEHYTALIYAHLQGQGHITRPDMTPDIRASSMYHKEASNGWSIKHI